MDNYKIPNTEEAISLLDELGFDVTGLTDMSSFLYAKAQDKKAFNGVVNPENYQFISVAKLNDLVVLNRKNPADGNYRLFISDSQGELNLYKTSDDVFYVFSKELKGWDKSRAVNIKTANLIKKGNEKDPAFISGAEALRALADGKEVEYLEVSDKWRDAKFLTANVLLVGDFSIRLKPQTIKLELELPKPFEPKDNDWVWTISGVQEGGVTQMLHRDGNDYPLGAWRTEEEIKQVVEQLRKIRGTNS